VLLRPSVLCPTDFSEASRGALRYAAAIAEHFYASLTVLAVDEVAPLSGAPGDVWPALLAKTDVEQFVQTTFGERVLAVPQVLCGITAGKAGPAILRFASELAPDLIVMSTHGATGIHKVLFGSTTERVLRETTVPILVTPPEDFGPTCIEDLKSSMRHVLVPIDLTPATTRQVHIARGLADAFAAALLLVHVVEASRMVRGNERLLPRLHDEQVKRVTRAVNELLSDLPARLHSEVLLRYGDPAAEITATAQERRTDMLVMGLHAVAGGTSRMGSVTHRVLCQLPRLVLALPPTEHPFGVPYRAQLRQSAAGVLP
jgi:nucleotide-binding universal stress UspA family protein